MRKSKSNYSTGDPLQCPKCGGRNTTTLATAFSYSSRFFREGSREKALPDAPEAPEKKSQLVVPAAWGATVATTLYTIILIGLTEYGIPWLREGGLFDYRFMIPSLIAGLGVHIALMIHAVWWNLSEYPDLLNEWHSTAICRRCSAQFRLPEEMRSQPRNRKWLG